jgi:hypothetical protein
MTKLHEKTKYEKEYAYSRLVYTLFDLLCFHIPHKNKEIETTLMNRSLYGRSRLEIKKDIKKGTKKETLFYRE